MTSASPQSAIRTRRVIYIPGYDPVPPRKYRERYRTQAAKQAALSGYSLQIGPRRGKGRFGWHVTAEIEGAQTQTEIDVMLWSDIVRGSMDQGALASYGALARTAWAYIGSGALFRLMRLRKGPVIAAIYPVFVLLAQGLFALALGLVIYRIMMAGGSFALRMMSEGPIAQPFTLIFALIAGLIGGAGAVGFLRWCKRRDHLLAWYLMHDYAFSARDHGAYPAAQEARMAEFADEIATALSSDVDEVLIIGHSSGAYIAISVLADVIRGGHVPATGPALSLLTLGHVVPMVSFLPRAYRLRADLTYLATSDALTWVDVTAPGDGCSFALCDPVAVSGVAPQTKRWPLVISAAYSQNLQPATWAALRWRLFEAHFQYLNAFDNLPGRADDYDYFRITAGPRSLGARFASRAPSPARIEKPVNRYTGVAA